MQAVEDCIRVPVAHERQDVAKNVVPLSSAQPRLLSTSCDSKVVLRGQTLKKVASRLSRACFQT